MKKGFTLIELLAVIVILAIVALIATPLILNVIDDAKEAVYHDNEQMMEKAAQTYLILNETELPSNINETVKIELEELQNKKLIGKIKDVKDSNSNCDGYVLVRKVSKLDYDYQTYLKCGDNYTSNSIITDGLVLDLPLGDYKDGDTYLDKSGYGNNGINRGSLLSSDRHGINDKASSFFDNNDYVEVPNSDTIDITSTITVSCWFKMRSFSGSYKNLVVKGNSGQQFYWFYLKDNRISGRIMSNGLGYGTSAAANFALNEWTHAAFTYDGHYFKIYKNGELIGEPYPFEGPIDPTPGSLKIAYLEEWWGEQLAWFFDGEIDDVRIYNRALTADEIRHNYNVDNFNSF